VAPSKETIADGSYKPLSRPLYMYPSEKAIKRPEVKAFMDFVVENYQALSDASQIVPMSEQQASEAQTALGGSAS
jgi:phosphate transport system substrate-binding protein